MSIQLHHCLALLLAALLPGCGSQSATPVIEFTEVPEAAVGGSARMERIAGRVVGNKPGEQIVLFAKSGTWWVQPFAKKPFTAIERDSSWKSTTHMGTEYAALLVEPGYLAPKTADTLPEIGRGVLAVAKAPGRPSDLRLPDPKRIQFSGYEWEVLQVPSDSGGVMHENRGENAWVDVNGRLHLKIARHGGQWTCAEVWMTRSLGYGTYTFFIRDMPRLEPGTVLGMFTWDDAEAGQNHREMDIELSQWGDPSIKNAQFTVQPYYVAANVFRFSMPTGTATHSFRWMPGRIAFASRQGTRVISEHDFTSGVPSPGAQKVHLNLYIYGRTRTPQQRGVEVVIEKFEYLP